MILGELNLTKLDERFRRTDRFLMEILKVRLANGGLSDAVAENKRKESKGEVYSKRRLDIEIKRIDRMKKWAEENEINSNFAASLMYQVITESCMVQDELMIKKVKNHESIINESDAEALYAYQQQNLLELTAAVAESYEEKYGKEHFGSELYFKFERKTLNGMISEGIPDKELAIDLGCATGVISFDIASRFKKVIGYDISPDMVAVANRKKLERGLGNLDFINKDIESGINLPDNSVSLAIMNMGTGSDLKNTKGVIAEIKRVLRPSGKFLISFYNAESLLNKVGFIPWPMTLSAYVDPDRRCLTVSYENNVYFLYARSRTVEEVKTLLSEFEVDVCTYPTLASILPNILTENCDGEGNHQPNEEVRKYIKKIDTELSGSPLNCGTYVIATGGKIS